MVQIPPPATTALNLLRRTAFVFPITLQCMVQMLPPATTALNALRPTAQSVVCSPSHTTAYGAPTVSTGWHPKTPPPVCGIVFVGFITRPSYPTTTSVVDVGILRHPVRDSLPARFISLEFRPASAADAAAQTVAVSPTNLIAVTVALLRPYLFGVCP